LGNATADRRYKIFGPQAFNIATVPSTGVTLVSSSNTRISVTLQNTSTVSCLVALSSIIPTSTAYHFVLSKDSIALAGEGGYLKVDEYFGYMTAATTSGSGTIAVLEVLSTA
jgi:hypothetical protein